MASSSKDIADFLGKLGLDLRQTDVDDIAAMLAALPLDEHDEVAPNIWEAVAQIIGDPMFDGDVSLPGDATP